MHLLDIISESRQPPGKENWDTPLYDANQLTQMVQVTQFPTLMIENGQNNK